MPPEAQLRAELHGACVPVTREGKRIILNMPAGAAAAPAFLVDAENPTAAASARLAESVRLSRGFAPRST